jgi:CspA family cold shock protein
MKTAVVKFWSEKGFGFLAPEDGSADVFAHISNVEDQDVEALVRGWKVSYEDGVSSRTGKTEARNAKVLNGSTGGAITSCDNEGNAGCHPRQVSSPLSRTLNRSLKHQGLSLCRPSPTRGRSQL